MRLLPALVLLVALPVAAQPAFSVRAGVSAATLTPQMFVEGVSRGAPAASLFATVPVRGLLSLRTEVFYSGEGVGFSPHSADIGDRVLQIDGGAIRTEYVGVGAFASVEAPVQGALLGAYAGPAVSFKVRERNLTRTEGRTFSNPSDLFYPVQATAVAGLTVGRGPLGLDLRYALSVHDVRDPMAIRRTRTVRSSVATAALVYRLAR